MLVDLLSLLGGETAWNTIWSWGMVIRIVKPGYMTIGFSARGDIYILKKSGKCVIKPFRYLFLNRNNKRHGQNLSTHIV